MTKVDLITGFLGAGKTTFIRKYLTALQNAGEKIRLIENEFGPISVDTMLLSDLEVSREDLTGLCMCCTGKNEFIRMLQDAAADGIDRIIVEPSGIYDVDEFFYVMGSNQVKAHCEIGSVITILDPNIPGDLTDETKYLMASQLLGTGKIVLSRTQEVTTETLEETRQWLKELFISYGSPRDPEKILETRPWNELTAEDYKELSDSGQAYLSHKRESFSHEETYQTALAAARCKDEEDVRERVAKLFSENKMGHILRIKGVARLANSSWVEVNATANTCSVRPRQIKRGLLVVIGQGLDEEMLQSFWRKIQ